MDDELAAPPALDLDDSSFAALDEAYAAATAAAIEDDDDDAATAETGTQDAEDDPAADAADADPAAAAPADPDAAEPTPSPEAVAAEAERLYNSRFREDTSKLKARLDRRIEERTVAARTLQVQVDEAALYVEELERRLAEYSPEDVQSLRRDRGLYRDSQAQRLRADLAEERTQRSAAEAARAAWFQARYAQNTALADAATADPLLYDAWLAQDATAHAERLAALEVRFAPKPAKPAPAKTPVAPATPAAAKVARTQAAAQARGKQPLATATTGATPARPSHRGKDAAEIVNSVTDTAFARRLDALLAQR